MAYHLTIVFGADAGTTFAIEEGQRCTVGRSEESDIRIEDDAVAWEHAVLFVEDNRLFIENLSALGTKVNGRPVNERTRTVNGDRIELAPNAMLTVESTQSSASGSGSMVVVLALIGVVILGAGVGATILWNFVLKDQFVQPAEQSQPADWAAAQKRFEEKLAEWVEEQRVPAEFLAAFERAWRFQRLDDTRGANRAYKDLMKDLIVLQHPLAENPRFAGRSFAASASPKGEELRVYLGLDRGQDPATMPWASDETHASGIVWFVRQQIRRTTEVEVQTDAFGGL